MNLTIKGLPSKVHQYLRKSARTQGRSLTAEIVQILQDHVATEQRRKRMRKSQEELERFVASLPPMSDSTHLIRADRRRATW